MENRSRFTLDISQESLPALPDPAELDAVAAQAAADLVREGESGNTVTSYKAALRYWSGWFALRYGRSLRLPLEPATVVQFIVDHAQRQTREGLMCELPASIDEALVRQKLKGKAGPLSLATILHRVSVISKVHGLRSLPNPCTDPLVKELLARTRSAYAKRGVQPRAKDALLKEHILKLVEVCNDGTLAGIRDKALILFAWASGGRRRSEVAHACVERLHRLGPAEYVFRMAYSKTNQQGRVRAGQDKPIVGPAGVALHAWLEASKLESGPLFRRILRGGHIAEGLTAAGVNKIVQRRCLQAGLEGNFSAHSLRSGFVTEAGRQNTPLPEAMALSGHASTAVFLGYFQAGTLNTSRGARLLDEAGGD